MGLADDGVGRDGRREASDWQTHGVSPGGAEGVESTSEPRTQGGRGRVRTSSTRSPGLSLIRHQEANVAEWTPQRVEHLVGGGDFLVNTRHLPR